MERTNMAVLVKVRKPNLRKFLLIVSLDFF